ncbi:hypothetical protein F0562_019462 [Nyssa sinensis]|uniref:Uncharacterized protein n=1 Tax=Nyssa sinensis TaxID=561372 RepID=A0A5J5BTU9_9ASTE|nr:hypothetical protein F0562_019462 [Nyssa sinensis]
MAKSMRSKREKRLRAIRREIVEPLYEKKEAAKLAAQEAALAAPKLPVRSHNGNTSTAMDMITTTSTTSATNLNMDVEMAEDNQSLGTLKPVRKIGKKLRKKIKMGKRKGHGKGKIRKKHNV